MILPGNYSIGGIEEIRTTKALNIHGPSPAEPPHIATSTDIGEMLTLGAGTRLADLEIEEKTNSYFGCAELGPGSTIERVRVVSSGQSGIITHEATVRDSIFVDSAESGAALFLVGPGTSVVRNVTSLATGDFGFALAISTTNSVEAAAAVGNSILFSGSTGTDVSLQAEESGSKARAVLDHSNFDPETIRTYGKGMDTKTLGAGNQDSQTTPPQLVDLAAGDAHETAGSPTIDAGLSSPDLGTLDFEGDARRDGLRAGHRRRRVPFERAAAPATGCRPTQDQRPEVEAQGLPGRGRAEEEARHRIRLHPRPGSGRDDHRAQGREAKAQDRVP